MRRFGLFQKGSSGAIERQDKLTRALYSLLIEKTRIFLLREIYFEDKTALKLALISLPDIFLLSSGLSLEKDMPRLSDTQEELETLRNFKKRALEASKGFRKQTQHLDKAKPSYVDLNELLRGHRIRFISKEGEIEQGLKEIEAQLLDEAPEFAQKLLEKWEAHSTPNPKAIEILIKPLHTELLAIAQMLKAKLIGPKGFLNDLVNFLPGEEEKLQAKASHFKSLAQFFHRYLSKLRPLLDPNLFDENQKISDHYSNLFIQASYIFELVKFSGDFDNYYQGYLAELNAKLSEFQKTSPKTLSQISFSKAKNELRREMAKLEILDELFIMRDFEKDKINLLSIISEKFSIAKKLLIYYSRASNDFRILNRKYLNKKVEPTLPEIKNLFTDITSLSNIRSKLNELQLRAQKAFGDNAFCPEIFLELFMVCDNLEKRLNYLKNRAHQACVEKIQAEFSLIGSSDESSLEKFHSIFDIFHLSDEMALLYTKSTALEKIRETAHAWLREKMSSNFLYHLNKQIKEGLLSIKPLSSLVEDFLMENKLSDISDILLFLNRKIDLLEKTPLTSQRIVADPMRWLTHAQLKDSVFQLKKARNYYFSLSRLDPLPLNSQTGELLQCLKNLHQVLKARELAAHALEEEYKEIWDDDTPLDKPWARQIMNNIEAEQERLQSDFLELQKGVSILASLDSLSDAHKVFFSKVYFPKLENEFRELSLALKEYSRQMCMYMEFEALNLSKRELELSPEEKLDESPRKKKHESDADDVIPSNVEGSPQSSSLLTEGDSSTTLGMTN